jgi:hypothetical protein
MINHNTYIDPGPRRSGRTTRIVDKLIQNLFTDGFVVCQDHYPSHDMELYVMRKILQRLNIEHHIADNQVQYNKDMAVICIPSLLLVNKVSDFLKNAPPEGRRIARWLEKCIIEEAKSK